MIERKRRTKKNYVKKKKRTKADLRKVRNILKNKQTMIERVRSCDETRKKNNNYYVDKN